MASNFDNRVYISIESPPVAGTSLALILQDFDFNNTFTLNVSGILPTDSEIQVSYKISTQLTTHFNQNSIYFSGVPSYVDLSPVQQYAVTRTDHCTCVWGQSNFTISASSDTNSIIHTNNQPTLLTVTDIKTLAPMKGVDLTDNEGNDLNDNQIATLSKLASAKLIAFTRNSIVTGHYCVEEATDWTWGIRLRKTPALDFYAPQVRRPIAFNLFSAVTYSTVKSNYILERDGYLVYRFAQGLVDYPEPFDRLNDVIIVYIAGYSTIPDDIENVILEIIPLIQADVPIGVDSYKGGSFEVKFGGYKAYLDAILSGLRPYYLTD